MDFTVADPSSLRVLSRTVQAAAKLSEHVQFTPHAHSLHLRLLTPSHSTYAVFRFNQPFFTALTLPSPPTAYKLSARILPSLLRGPQTISSARVEARGGQLRLTVVTQSKLTKRFILPLIEGRISSIHTPPARNTLHTSAAFLSDLLANFHAKLDEITLIPTAENLTIVSFVDDTANPSNAFLRTEITVDARQFDHHNFTTHSSCRLTFQCRPLRTVVEYCDFLDIPIRLAYDLPAYPVQLDVSIPSPSGDPYYDALFVFSSRTIPDYSPQNPSNPVQANLTGREEPPTLANLPARPLNLQPGTQNPNQDYTSIPVHTPGRHRSSIQQPSQELPDQSAPIHYSRFSDTQSHQPFEYRPSPTLIPTAVTSLPHHSSAFHQTAVPASDSYEQEFEYQEEEEEDDYVEGTPPP